MAVQRSTVSQAYSTAPDKKDCDDCTQSCILAGLLSQISTISKRPDRVTMGAHLTNRWSTIIRLDQRLMFTDLRIIFPKLGSPCRQPCFCSEIATERPTYTPAISSFASRYVTMIGTGLVFKFITDAQFIALSKTRKVEEMSTEFTTNRRRFKTGPPFTHS